MIVKLEGGQGNQMFQYAMGRAVCVETGEPLLLDISFFNKNERNFELDKYRISYDGLITENRAFLDIALRMRGFVRPIRYLDPFLHLYCERASFDYENIKQCIVRNRKYIFWGYWQNTKYFAHIRDILLKDFTYKLSLNQVQCNIMEDMKKQNSVAMHIRRTDYLVPGSYEHFAHPTRVYYDNALNYIQRQVGTVNTYIFSDDIEWCRKEFADYTDTVFVDQSISTNQQVDMELMRHCKYFVIANSTFSWWGAYLAEYVDKIVLAPYDWYRDPNSNLNVGKALLNDMIKIDEKGRRV